MKILGVDTSSKVATCAVCEDDKLICEYVLNNKLTHSQTIMPIIDDCLRKSELSPSDIDVYAVSEGPGSFTGLRIGVTTVKGLAHATDKPVVGVNTLEALAYNLPYCPYMICPIMDARRDQVYNAVYKFDDLMLGEIKPPRAIAIEDLMAEFETGEDKVVFLGDGVPVFKDIIKEKLGDRALFAPANANMQRASGVCMAAFDKDTMHYGKLAPVYLRKSQAEREREERGNV